MREFLRRVLVTSLACLAVGAAAPGLASPQRPVGAGGSTVVGSPGGLGSPRGLGAYGPWQARSSATSTVWIQRVATPAEALDQSDPSIAGTWFVLSIPVPATNSVEFFTLHVPEESLVAPRPLLTCFHVSAASHLDIWFNTNYVREAIARKWFLLAPLQANPVPGSNPQLSFASAASQEHVQAALRFVIEGYSVDLDRLYGVGFSMGGGNALSYAARHRDRSLGAFAGVVNHTGTVSVSDVYQNASTTLRQELDLTFGGSPAAVPFPYRQSSLIELDPTGALVPGGRHMATNLAHVPLRSYYNPFDPLQYLVRQTQELSAYFSGIPGASHTVLQRVSGCHCWATVDEAEVCDWFDGLDPLPAPLRGELLMDRDALWESFDVDLRCSDCFGSFRYEVDPSLGRITIENVENVASVTFDLAELGLGSSTPDLSIETSSADGTGRSIVIEGLASPPIRVERSALLVSASCVPLPGAPSWCWNPSSATLELDEPGAATTVWTVVP